MALSCRRIQFEPGRYWVGSRSRPDLLHLVDTDDDGVWACGCEDSFYHGNFCGHLRTVRRRMNEKKKYPRAVALAVAAELCRALAPACARLVVAGSLRRRKEQVGDVEVLFVPRFEDVPDGLFDRKLEDQAERVIADLVARGVLAARIGAAGGTSWGPKNKLAVHEASRVPVDLFTATDANWWNYLVCRTGGAENNVALAQAAQAKGWKWNPYGPGFTDDTGRIVPVASKQDVFRLAGLPYLPPEQRK